MRTDTWRRQETAWAACLVLKDVDWRLSLLDPLLDLVRLEDKMTGGKIGYCSQESQQGLSSKTHLVASFNRGGQSFLNIKEIRPVLF